MNSFSEDIKTKLVSDGEGVFGASSGWGIFISREPDAPNSTVVLYDTGGGGVDRLLGNGELFNPNVQIRIRTTSYPTAYAKALSVLSSVKDMEDNSFDDIRYAEVTQITDIIVAPQDEKRRTIFTVTVNAKRG